MATPEVMPNEMFEEIFQYIPSCDLYYGFYNLNSRINSILHHLHQWKFDLLYQCSIKHDCQDLISKFNKQIIYLLMDANDFCLHFQSKNYINLKSLVLLCESITTNQLNELVHQLGSLKQLTSLSLTLCCHENYNYGQILLTIPTLKRYLLSGADYTKFKFILPTTCIISNLEYMNIDPFSPNSINVIINQLLNLKYLNVDIFEQLTPSLLTINKNLSLTYLRINIHTTNQFDEFEIFVEYFPNLKHLSCCIYSPNDFNFINDQRWQSLITTKLINLKYFYCFIAHLESEIKEQAKTTLLSFQNEFWLQWNTKCVYDCENGSICIQTQNYDYDYD
ncbi:unnamed protein product [Didymodactylos carnosus]|uniref:F-box domain-containing protein n=1 Tax=Didymodactylos carnosus TaxID=1234261 RepID=A0A813PXV3_9BILA|nr:unnamed protein product [Didymodactylos carnosus]CAF3535577.1 unnamed protein product [Didymodactylos carnosus]